MLCHGQGDQDINPDPFLGGCCFVNGAVCPNRWYIEPGAVTSERIVRDNNRNSLGTVDNAARGIVGNSGPKRTRIIEAVQGTRYICKAALLAVDVNPNILSNRNQFDTAWAARPEYQPIADAWQAMGKPRNYCQIYGPNEGQCCFKETTQINDARAANLTPVIVNIRRAAPGAS